MLFSNFTVITLAGRDVPMALNAQIALANMAVMAAGMAGGHQVAELLPDLVVRTVQPHIPPSNTKDAYAGQMKSLTRLRAVLVLHGRGLVYL
jgi:hypothetical protein